MVREADFQKKVVQWLKKKGCIVLKYEQNATTRAGVSDLFFCKEGFYGFIETKKSKTAKLRPGQKEFIEKVAGWSYGRIVYPENWGETQKELEDIL